MKRLLDPRVWDTLEPLGEGSTGRVFRAGRYVVKVAHPEPESRQRLKEEVWLHRWLEERKFPVPKLRAFNRRALVRDFIDGVPARDDVLIERLRKAGEGLGLRFDLASANLLRAQGRVWLIDPGRRGARDGQGGQRIAPVRMPPSGRFAVEVPMQLEAGTKLLWINEGLRGRLGLALNDARLGRLTRLTTSRRGVLTALATRYTDMIALDLKRGPKGDGRSVLVGRTATHELSLKGCGPTPLRWKGRRFHEDGRVSVPRTLWEASIADELARLGFDVPEYLAIAQTRATTVDNTLKRWPAATGLRVAKTFLRLGHLRAVAHEPEKLRALVRHAQHELGVKALGPGFARNLGLDAGRADALQIHGFNPTPGNVRLDGHPLDFSTIRFFRHHAADYRVLEDRFTVRQHRALWLRQVRLLAELLGSKATALDRAYQSAWLEGFARGLEMFWRVKFSRAEVELALKLRAETDGTQHFRFWQRTASAPLFDLVGSAPKLQRALALGLREPWRALLRRFDAEVSSRAQALAERWVAAVRRRLRTAKPRRWEEVIRPGMELETLARTCYRGSLFRWRRFIATSKHLPEGRYRYAAAKAWAEKLGHVALPRVDGGGEERVVGLTPELLASLRAVIRSVLGSRLVGVIAHGSRVMERSEVFKRDPRAFTDGDLRLKKNPGLREGGPSETHSSDLDLKIFVRKGPDLSAELGAAMQKLGAWFPLPRHPRLIVTRAKDPIDAFNAWNGAARKRQQGKDPIPSCQAVLLAGPGARAASPSSRSTPASDGHTVRTPKAR